MHCVTKANRSPKYARRGSRIQITPGLVEVRLILGRAGGKIIYNLLV